MKKTVITILLVLPFLLIYFISFTGQVLSKYTHIYVEKIVALDEKGNEYADGDYIKISKGEEYNLNIKIYPELASNKKITISNSNKNVCSIDSTTCKVVGLEYGVSKLIITSVDRHYVQYIINIRVADDDISEIIPAKTSLTLVKGKTEFVGVIILPTTTIDENRHLVWESADERIARVDNGTIYAIGAGTTTITVRSQHKPEIMSEITVTVISEYGEGIFFDHGDYDTLYVTNTNEFDLKTITIINLEDITIDDIWYELKSTPEAGALDTSRLSEGIIKFNKEKSIVIVSVNVFANGEEYSDKIKIWYVQG